MSPEDAAIIHIGIDMHGTLITDREERIPPPLIDTLIKALASVRRSGFAKVYLCTGNDLGFVKRKIEPEVLAELDGHVLEVGCVISDGKRETPVVPDGVASSMRRLEEEIRRRDFHEIYKFAERKVIVSIFTKHGTPPEALLPRVQEVIDANAFSAHVKAVCSSVAVDVIPTGFNKLTGMRRVAKGEPVMGIADSMNDADLVLGADLAAVPSNTRPDLLDAIRASGRNHIHLIDEPVTAAVIEALRRVAKGELRIPGG